jgi:hypothetical protein
LRLAIAPAYVDGELGFKQLLLPTTDVGLGFYGGMFGANYYEVRQGKYYQKESFDGSGGGMGLSDLYPFVIPAAVIEKLHFIHQVINPILSNLLPAHAISLDTIRSKA